MQLLVSAICFKLIAMTALLVQTPPLFAQTSGERRLEFEQLTVNDGLSQNFVTCILQDRQGFMWFGTRDGLNRYDGYEFKVYAFDAEDTTSISANAIQSLYEDKQGNLWVGTWFGGLNKYDRARDRFVHYSYEQEAPSGPTLNLTFPIQEDSRKAGLWLGTADGLKRFDPQTGKFTSFFYKPEAPPRWKYNSVFAILEAEDGNLWLGTPQEFSGLLYFNRTTETFAHFKIDPKPFAQKSLIIRAICRDQNGNLWVGDAAGLFRVNEQWLHNQVSNPAPNGSQDGLVRVADPFTEVVFALCQDEAGDLWIGSPNGLFIYDVAPQLSSTKPAMENRGVTHILSNIGITSIYKDRSGLMWLGTNGNGIYKLRSAQQRFGGLAHNSEEANSLGNSVRAICETGDSTLWIGGYNGLNKLDRKSGRVTHLPRQASGSGSEVIWAIYEDPLSAGRILWIGTERDGLYRFDRAREKSTRYQNAPGNPRSLNDNFVLSIYRDSSNTLWVGTNSGLNRFDDRTEKFTQYNHDPQNPRGLRGAFILSILESRYVGRRVLWLATTNGLSCFDPATEQFAHFQNEPRNPQSLSHNEVLCLKQDRRGRIWIGTAGGLNQLILDKNQTENRDNRLAATFVHYTQKNGLPSNVINGILEDEAGKLWLSTNKGLSQLVLSEAEGFNPETATFQNFDASDGLQSNEFNRAAYFQCRHGEMFFGGVNGINMFFSQAAKDNPHLPPVVLTDFKLFNKPVGLATNEETPLKKVVAETEEIRLSHKDNVFSFEFAALEYTAPEKNQYAYKMEGFDKDWIELGVKREAVYTNLAPGKYTFRVKASNNDGVWNEKGASIKITITPPWWKTWWAYALYGVIFFGTFYGLWRYEMNRQQFKNRMELKQVEAEKLQELDRMKSRFFANISHEFRTPMTLILGPLEQMLAEEPQPNWKKFIPMMHRHANRLLRLINQLLDLAKLESGGAKLAPTHGDFVAFLKGLVMSFDSLAVHKRIALKFAAQPAALPSYFDRDKIEKIFSNLLSNAFKFTPEGGEISVQCSVISNQLSVASNQLGHNQLITDHCLLITVKDTGIGISPAHLPHIFDRFYQVDTSTSSVREHEGAGIGLALVKELVELHNGDISVKSEEGKGAEFIVRLFLPVISDQSSVLSDQLPVTSDLSSVISDQLQVTSDEQQATSNERPATSDQQPDDDEATIILVIEDNVDMRAYIRQYLEPDYKVLEAADGEQGIATAIAAIPDLVICDVMMPKKDGYEVCRTLKTDERTSHVPVILLTAKAAPQEKLEGLETGADDYLLKPFDSKELLARVKNLIALRRKLQEKFKKQMVLRPSEISIASVDEAFLKKVVALVEAHLEDESFSPENLAREAGMSRAQFYRKLRALTDQPAGLFIRSIRLQRAADLLKQGFGNITEIAYKVGFSSQPYFSKCFLEYFGMSPTEYKEQNA